MKTINQTVTLNGSPHKIYEMLMDSKKHEEFTESKVDISKKVGGKFECYDGWIQGENIELVQDKKIVQKWRGSDWDEGVWSKLTFELKEKDGKTELTMTHEDVPDDKADDIDEGWKEHYWEKMEKVLKEGK